MSKRITITVISLFFWVSIQAQDTLRVMVYNLLYYGYFTDFCTPQNNHPDLKDGYLRTILSHDLPDIFVVNEIGRIPTVHQRIIDSVFNRITNKQYDRAASMNNSNSSIMNMLYYNSEKLALKSQHIVQSTVRDIDLYTLYYLSPDLINGDTVIINCIAAHLKAGSTASDQQTRTLQINNVIAWLQNNRMPGNYLFMGDFNAKSSNEQAMQNLFFGPNAGFRFYDPINQLGHWNSSIFASYHTQSTHTSGSCHSGGGMDDRFDLITVSLDIMQGNKKVTYVEGSYTALGQDGLRYNSSLISPTNNSAPAAVIQALYNNSDHLPVLLSLAIDQSPASVGKPFQTNAVKVQNPVSDEIRISFSEDLATGRDVFISLYSIHGELLYQERTANHQSFITIPVSQLKSGFYVLRLQTGGYSQAFKIIKL